MNISIPDLDAQVERARSQWPFILPTEITFGLPRGLLFAVGSRETNLTNEVGDGGHGHGVWQLDDRSHTIPDGFDQDIETQCHYAAGMLAQLFGEFRNWSCVLAAYNAGAGTVRYNLANGLPVDTGTAGNDYSTDVLSRLTVVQVMIPAPSNPTEDDVSGKALIVDGGQSIGIFVVSRELTTKVPLNGSDEVSALQQSGEYVDVKLSAQTLGRIPQVG